MKNKELKFGLEARKSIKKGIDILGDAVGSTLGPKGRLVVLADYELGKPHITKDGVTVAKNIQLKDKYANAGACLIREASLKMLSTCGDSTTTSTVLAQEMVNKAMKAIQKGYNPIEIKRGIEEAAATIITEINKIARPIKGQDIESIATISANNDTEIGKLIADTFKKITNDGVIVVEESPSIDTTVNIIQGMQFERGYLADHFVTDAVKNQCVLENPYILITEQKINRMIDLVPILEKVAAENRAILIIAEDFDSEVLENLKMNKLQGILKVCPVKAPSFGQYRKEVLDDISILTSGTNLTYESKLYIPDIDVDMLGRCEKVIVTKEYTTIIGGKTSKDAIQDRVDILKARLSEEIEEGFMTEFLRNRISKLVGGIATIYVGGTTELEMKERRDRVDDAIAATKAAMEEGVVPGGGITYLKIIPESTVEFPKIFSIFSRILGLKNSSASKQMGEKILIESLPIIFNTIIDNAGLDIDMVRFGINPSENIGFDANTEEYVNMFDAGIINPAKSERLALENAISVVNLFLSLDCVITDEPDPIILM